MLGRQCDPKAGRPFFPSQTKLYFHKALCCSLISRRNIPILGPFFRFSCPLVTCISSWFCYRWRFFLFSLCLVLCCCSSWLFRPGISLCTLLVPCCFRQRLLSSLPLEAVGLAVLVSGWILGLAWSRTRCKVIPLDGSWASSPGARLSLLTRCFNWTLEFWTCWWYFCTPFFFPGVSWLNSSVQPCSRWRLAISLSTVILVSSPAVLARSWSVSSKLNAELLNPWLNLDGGSILRAANSSFNWVSRSSAKCTAEPTLPACPATHCEIGVESDRWQANKTENDGLDINQNWGWDAGNSDTSSASQCLPYLHTSHKDCICAHKAGAKRIDTVRKYFLRHCYHFNLWHVLNDSMREGIARSRDQCYTYLQLLEDLDNLAAQFICQFEDIIRRYDCAQSFSSRSSCQTCKVAYRQWMCSMVLPWWSGDQRIKPCRTFCHEVERLCPYFLPAEKTGPGSQYAGEPTFLCIDPDIKETLNQSLNSAYGDDNKCYRPCTLNYNLEPDVDPSQCLISLDDEDSSYVNQSWSIDNKTEDCQDESGMDSHLDSGQCQQYMEMNSQNSQVSSCAWTFHLRFGWRWRTLVLPYFLLFGFLYIVRHTFISLTIPFC